DGGRWPDGTADRRRSDIHRLRNVVRGPRRPPRDAQLLHAAGRMREHRQRVRRRVLRRARDAQTMTRLAYFDLASGVSGDMAIAATVHAGRNLSVDVESVVLSAIESLGLGCAIEFIDDVRGGIACLRVEIKDTGARYTASEL